MFKITILIVIINLMTLSLVNSAEGKDDQVLESNKLPNDWNITFNLFLPNDRNKQIVLNFTSNDTTIKNSGFDPKHKTKFIVHGWRSGFYTLSLSKRHWMKDIKDYILNETKANVICVDWSKPAADIDYDGVLPKVVVVGEMVAHFIKRLTDLMNVSHNDMHCIGHSLGAHVCGFAGKALASNKLSQITGLDPARPGFDQEFDNSTGISFPPLSKSDANLVLVIHTSAGFNTSGQFNVVGFVGNPNPLGHYDFRINGGNVQPMCHEMSKAMQAIKAIWHGQFGQAFQYFKDGAMCPHESAYIYPITKPDNECQLIAYKCLNYKDFESGKCADEGLPLEFNFDYYENPNKIFNQTETPNNLFIKTSDSSPFCLFHYQFVIETENPMKSDALIQLKLRGHKTIQIKVKLSPKTEENIYYYLYTSAEELGYVSEVFYDKKVLKIKNLYINYLSHINKSVRKENSSKPRLIEKGDSWFDWISDLIESE